MLFSHVEKDVVFSLFVHVGLGNKSFDLAFPCVALTYYLPFHNLFRGTWRRFLLNVRIILVKKLRIIF